MREIRHSMIFLELEGRGGISWFLCWFLECPLVLCKWEIWEPPFWKSRSQVSFKVDVFCVGWQPHAIGLVALYPMCAQWRSWMALLNGLYCAWYLAWSCWAPHSHDRPKQVNFHPSMMSWILNGIHVCSLSKFWCSWFHEMNSFLVPKFMEFDHVRPSLVHDFFPHPIHWHHSSGAILECSINGCFQEMPK